MAYHEIPEWVRFIAVTIFILVWSSAITNAAYKGGYDLALLIAVLVATVLFIAIL